MILISSNGGIQMFWPGAVKSELKTKETKELEKAVASELAKSGGNERDEVEKFQGLWQGAESPKPSAAQNE